MRESLQDVRDWLGNLARAPMETPTWVRIPPAQVVPAADGDKLVPELDYFRVRVHQIHLRYGREWLEKYAPMLLVATEFSYAGEKVTRPTVIGPGLIEQLGAAAPDSASIAGTVVAGPTPLRGGSVTVTLSLHRVSRGNVADGFLDVVEGVSKALDLVAGISPYTALARVVVSGVTSLTGGDRALIARRDEFAPLAPGYFALVSSDAQLPADRLGVRDGQLIVHANGAWQDVTDADFVLYSVDRVPSEEIDVTRLPLHRQWQAVLEEANKADTPEIWTSTKTNLSSLIGMAFTSADLTFPHAEALEREWTDKVRRRRERAQERGEMGGEPRGLDDVRARALAVLDM